MHHAVFSGHLPVMKWLFEKDPTLIQKTDNYGHTCMHLASQEGYTPNIEWLHQKDSTLIYKARQDGWSPAHSAAYCGKLEALQWLHQKDPALLRKITTNDRQTVAEAALEMGHHAIAAWVRTQGG